MSIQFADEVLAERSHEISEAFELASLSVCNCSCVLTDNPLRILTPFDQWSYAVMVPKRLLSPNEDNTPVAVHIEAEVHAGIVGFGFVHEDGATYVKEVEQAFIDQTGLEVQLDALKGIRWLIVRNAAPGHIRSDVIIRSVRVSTRSHRKTIDGGERTRVQIAERWGNPPDDAINWARIPAMRRRAGNFGEVMSEYLGPAASAGRVLSLCCGHGHLERTVLQSIRYGICDALDLSQGALAKARVAAKQAGISNVNYIEQDINLLHLSSYYDLVFASGLHHIFNLEHVFSELSDWMRPGAPFMMYEYIGPNRCQPTARQLKAINACIQLLPEKYRLRVSVQRRLDAAGPEDGLRILERKREELFGVSHDQIAPGPISKDPAFSSFFWNEYTPMTPEQWNVVDPSEAIRSEDIIPLLQEYFSDVDVRYQGGSIVQFALHDIAANFYDDSPETQALLEMLIQIEDVLTQYDREIPQDYAVIVARNPHVTPTRRRRTIVQNLKRVAGNLLRFLAATGPEDRLL